MEIGKSKPYGFFDGASQGNFGISGTGGMLKPSSSGWIQFECGLGVKNNNEVEI